MMPKNIQGTEGFNLIPKSVVWDFDQFFVQLLRFGMSLSIRFEIITFLESVSESNRHTKGKVSVLVSNGKIWNHQLPIYKGDAAKRRQDFSNF